MKLFPRLFRAKKRAAVENSFESMPIFHQTLQFPFPLSWPLEPLHRELDGGKFVLEFCGLGQNSENWQEKLTIQSFNSANDDVDMNARMLLKMMRDEMQSLNEEAFYYEELYCETVVTKERVAVLMGLKAEPDQEKTGQFGLYMVLEGDHDIYIVQRAWRGENRAKEGAVMPRDELEAWLEDFKKIALLDNASQPEGG